MQRAGTHCHTTVLSPIGSSSGIRVGEGFFVPLSRQPPPRYIIFLVGQDNRSTSLLLFVCVLSSRGPSNGILKTRTDVTKTSNGRTTLLAGFLYSVDVGRSSPIVLLSVRVRHTPVCPFLALVFLSFSWRNTYSR